MPAHARLGLLLVTLLLATVGCESTPEPVAVPPQPETMFEFAERVGDRLADLIVDSPEISDLDYKIVIEFGDIVNNSRTMSAAEFATLRTTMRNRLVNDRRVRYNAAVVERIEEMERRATDYSEEKPEDLLGENYQPDPSIVDRYDLETVYVLTGILGDIRDRGEYVSVIEVSLTHLKSREVIFSEQFVRR